jgi:hypothetical protein
MLNGRAIWCLDHGRPIAAQACSRVPGRYVSRLFFIMTLSFTAVVAADASRDLRAQAPKATIVGPGAATCQRFNDDIKSNPLLRRDYLDGSEAGVCFPGGTAKITLGAMRDFR